MNGHRRRSDAPVHTLLVDNYDSYTYNLFQLLAIVNGREPTVVYNVRLCPRQVAVSSGANARQLTPAC